MLGQRYYIHVTNEKPRPPAPVASHNFIFTSQQTACVQRCPSNARPKRVSLLAKLARSRTKESSPTKSFRQSGISDNGTPANLRSQGTPAPHKESPAISHAKPDLQAAQRGEPRRFHLGNLAAVLLAALFMTWPALYNRFPLLYPDSMTYIEDGPRVARAVFLHQLSDYYGMRSFFYSLGILPFDWDVTLWPVVALQSVLTAYILWLVARSLFPRPFWRYLVLCVLLSFLTSVSWFASLIMPDILGPVLYLCIYLLVFAADTLSLRERLVVMLIAWWAITSHATHLCLAVGTCLFLAALVLLRQQSRPLWRGVGQLALVIFLAAAAQIALHAYLYGEPSLNGDRPPFLMARVIADGPGRWYLQQHCGQPNVTFVLCDYVQKLSVDSDDFIWGPNGVWQSVPIETRERLQKEEIPFVLATLRAYPSAQLSKSAHNFWQQLTTFSFEPDASDWTLKEFDTVLPNQRAAYLRSRQSQNDLAFDLQTPIQNWTVIVSLAVIAAFALRQFRRPPPRLMSLAAVIIPMVLANAFVTGALSTVEDRYQSRVVWLVPFLALILLLDWRKNLQRPIL